MDLHRKFQYDQVYMKMAVVISDLSYSLRNKVGCIIISKNGQIISQGFNGTPSGYNNCCEDVECKCKWSSICEHYDEPIKQIVSVEKCNNIRDGEKCNWMSLKTRPEVLHAESNAISKCAKWMSSTDGATLYVTLSPCLECAKLIIQAGISRVCYLEEYRDTSGIEFLKKNNIIVDQIIV